MQLQQGEHIFDILSHFKIAQNLIFEQEERRSLANLALTASNRARQSTAYSVAINLLHFGIELLKEDPWEKDYLLVFSLHKLLAECECLERNFDAAESFYQLLLEKAKTNLDKISVYFIQANQYDVQQQYDKSIQVMIESLQLFGISFPESDEELDNMTKQAIREIYEEISKKRINEILNELLMEDEEQIAIVKMLVNICAPCYSGGRQSLLAAVSTKAGLYSIRNGICEFSSAAFVFLSLSFVSRTSDFQLAYDFGRLSLALARRFNNPIMSCKSFFVFAVTTNLWTHPLNSSNIYLEDAFRLSIEAGDLSYAPIISSYLISDRYYQSMELQEIQTWSQKYLPNLKTNQWMYCFCMCGTQSMRYLMGLSDNFDYKIATAENGSNPVLESCYYFGKMELSFWQNDTTNSLQYVDKFLNSAPTYLTATFKIIQGYFFAAMIIMLHKFNNPAEKHIYDKKLEVIISKMQKFSRECECNVQHKYYLLVGQKKVMEGEFMEGLKYFDLGIQAARKYSFTQFEALGHELLLGHWLSNFQPSYANIHLNEAISLYKKWGANGRVEYLKGKYTQLNPTIESKTHTVGVDQLAISKVSQVLSNEVDTNLEHFLELVVKLIIENSGAEKGLFIIGGEHLVVVAEGRIDKVNIYSSNPIPIIQYRHCPQNIIHFVNQTRETILIGNCTVDEQFSVDPYVKSQGLKSVLCMPVNKKKSLNGMIYLENNLIQDAFTEKHKYLVGILCSQMAFSMELLESEKSSRALVKELEIYKNRLEEFVDVLCHELRNPL